MTPQELKKSILYLAFKGKLSSQNSDESSDVLSSNILKHGYGNKKYLSFKAELAPYDIPENWSWCMFHNVVSLENGRKQSGLKLPYLEAKYLRGNAEAKYLEDGEVVNPGTKVILVDGENSGEVFFVNEKGYMGSTFKVLNIFDSLDEKYVLLFMKLHQDDYRNNKKGAAIPHLNKNVFFEMPFPIPPLEEQHRIVLKIEELLPLVDRYEETWNKLEKLNNEINSNLEKSILQFAMQGKLVNHSVEEGTGQELLKEWKKLYCNNQKTEPINDEEIPFEIPDNWVWCRLGEISESNIGLTYSPSDIVQNGGTLVLRSSNIQNGEMSYLDNVFVSCNIPESSKIKKGDLLICARNGSRALVGKCAIVDKDGCSFGAFMAKVSAQYVPFIKYFLQSPCFRKQLEGVKTVTINQITQKNLKQQLIPLPPLAEQKRIVAKIEELLPLCRKLIK